MSDVFIQRSRDVTVTGPPAFRPKSGGKLTVNQLRSAAFRPSQIQSRDLIQKPRVTATIDERRSDSMKVSIKVDVSGRAMGTLHPYLDYGETHQPAESGTQTFFSKVMSEKFGIVSTKRQSSQGRGNQTFQ